MNAKRKTRKHAESKSNLFDAGALEELSRLFHETRQTLGPQQADADWMSDPLDEWLVNLDSGENEEHKNVEKSGVAKLEPQRSIFARFTAPLMHSGHTPIRAGAHKIKP